MNQTTKKILLLSCFIAIVIIGYYLIKKQEISVPPSHVENQPLSIQIPFDFNQFFTNELKLTGPKDFTNSSGSVMVSFNLPPNDVAHQTRNPGFLISIDHNEIGEVGGQALSAFGYSPNNNYFVSKSRFVCGATCFNFEINLIKIKEGKIERIPLPPMKKVESNDKNIVDTVVYPESVSWDSENNLKIEAYQIGFERGTGKLFRITSKEVWSYNLISGKYSLTETLTE